MAKVSSIDKNKKRKILEQKYRVKREKLKESARVSYIKGEIPFGAQFKLQSIPRNANPTRGKNRCELCGRSRSVYRRFKMCRLCLRKFAMLGLIPGLKKSSW